MSWIARTSIIDETFVILGISSLISPRRAMGSPSHPTTGPPRNAAARLGEVRFSRFTRIFLACCVEQLAKEAFSANHPR